MAGQPASDAPAENRKRRKASKEQRRQELIEATIECLARHGYAETTLADVADVAGLSRGIVNFHFESKEKLLEETLRHMAAEYALHWQTALRKAPDHPAERLRALVEADFDRAISSRRKLAAWVAFWGEAKSRPTYKALCEAQDTEYRLELTRICAALVALGQRRLDATALAWTIEAMLEGLWLRLMMGAPGFGRMDALAAARQMLCAVFPEHYAVAPVPLPGPAREA